MLSITRLHEFLRRPGFSLTQCHSSEKYSRIRKNTGSVLGCLWHHPRCRYVPSHQYRSHLLYAVHKGRKHLLPSRWEAEVKELEEDDGCW